MTKIDHDRRNNQMRSKNICLFCGAALRGKTGYGNRKTDEHIIAQWLMDHLGIRDMPISPVRIEAATRRVLDIRHHTVGTFVAGRVCANCNGGWMSDLENDAKPLLIRLIADPHELTTLTRDERMIVARWAVKTAAVLNRASSHGNLIDTTARPVVDEHMKAFMMGRIPDGVAVLAGGCTCQTAFAFLQWAAWAAPKNSIPLRQEDRDRSYKIGFSLRDLRIGVVYYPSTEYCYGVTEHQYVSLWDGDRRIIALDRSIEESPVAPNSPIEGFLRNIFLVSQTLVALVANVVSTRLIL